MGTGTNYKYLLVKYIKHVRECEGTDFISGSYYSDLNEEDRKELERLMGTSTEDNA